MRVRFETLFVRPCQYVVRAIHHFLQGAKFQKIFPLAASRQAFSGRNFFIVENYAEKVYSHVVRKSVFGVSHYRHVLVKGVMCMD